MIEILINYLKAIKDEKYKQVTTITLISFQWGIAIINEALETLVLWNDIKYSLRECLLKSFFELVYYCNDFLIMYSTAYIV